MAAISATAVPLQWHNECDDILNHQSHDCFLNCLFRCRSTKTSKLRVTGLCAGNSPVTGEFPAQRASNVENVFIWWRHHALSLCPSHFDSHFKMRCQYRKSTVRQSGDEMNCHGFTLYMLVFFFFFYPRPVLAFRYCRCLCLSVGPSVDPCVNRKLMCTTTCDPF